MLIKKYHCENAIAMQYSKHIENLDKKGEIIFIEK
jgi:predicted Zn-dependent protease